MTTNDDSGRIMIEPAPEASLDALDTTSLLADQRRAFDIIHSHMQQTLSGNNPPQLLMQIQGEGGTGKLRVIQTVTQGFQQRGASAMLIKAAYTGIATSLIGGQTTHRIAFLTTRGNALDALISQETRQKLEAFCRDVHYLIIDEVSMISAEFLAILSKRITVAKAGDGEAQNADFGGVNVVYTMWRLPSVSPSGQRASVFPLLSCIRSRHGGAGERAGDLLEIQNGGTAHGASSRDRSCVAGGPASFAACLSIPGRHRHAARVGDQQS
jgi:hypothetical protein